MVGVVAALLILLAACSGSDELTEPADPGCAPTANVFVRPGAPEARRNRIGQVIEDAPGVTSSVLHTPEEAYREFKRAYRQQPEIYETKDVSDFPARFEVTLESTQSYDLFERSVTGATTGVQGIVPGGCATETP